MKQLHIIIFYFFCFTTCIQAEQTGARIVHFPKDRPVGRLMIRDKNPNQRPRFKYGWELSGQAQGDVTIPTGKQLRLEVYEDAMDITFISELRPNDLESLSLNRTNLVDEDFVHLKDLTGLVELDISSMKQIDGSGLALLSDLKSLRKLTCFNANIADSAMEHISKIPSLEDLSLYMTQIDGFGLIHIKNIKSLKKLSLSKTSITDESLAYLKDMTELKELELYDTQIGDNGLAHLKGLTSLEKLILGSVDRGSEISPITDAGLAHLSPLTRLKSLGLYRTHITDEGLKYLGGLTSLESINLNRTQITGEGFAFLNKSAPLKGLELDECTLTAAGLAGLKSWSNTLENLDMDGAKINDADLIHLADLKALKYINLSNTPITDEGLIHIKNIKSLETLYFRNTKITDGGLITLKDLPNLKNINVTGTLVTNAGLEGFKQASTSKSIEANVSRRMVSSKQKGSKIIKHVLKQPEPQPLPLIGKSIPDLEKINVDLDLLKEKTALICFWDMNQRPSRNCIIQLGEKTQELAEKDIIVAAVHVSKIEQSKLNEWIKDNNIPFPVGMIEGDSENIQLAWGVKSLPWLILFDSEHIVRAEGFSLSELNEKIEKTLKPATQEEIQKRQREVAETEIKRLGGKIVTKTSENGRKRTEVNLFGPKYENVWTGGDEGIKYLKWLPNLTKLRIQDVEKFTDKGMEQLKDITSLESFILVRCNVSDEGLVYLKNMKNLEFLGLWNNDQFTNKSLDYIVGLAKLKSLRLDNAQITDNGIKKLKQHGTLNKLEFLVLSGTKITDAGLAHLQEMDNLKRLYLRETQTGDDGLKYLSGLTNLEAIILNDTKITGAGMVHLKGLKKLKLLYMQNTGITDNGLKQLKELTDLVQLWLGGTKITDAGLVHIRDLTNLQSVSLDSTGITDKGLAHLKLLTNLNELYLNQTNITIDGYLELNDALPDCQLYWEGKN